MTLRKSAYTGENRCWPCTAVNVVAVALLSAVVALAGSLEGASAVGAVGLVAVWLRGYVVPGTPQLVQFLPAAVLRRFGKATPSDGPSTGIVPTIREADLVATDTDGSVRLPDEIQAQYAERARELALDRERLREAVVDAFPVVATVSANRGFGGDETWFAKDGDGNVVQQWDSRAVAAMDVAGAELLAERLDGWNRYDPRRQRQACALLRQGANTCPSCSGEFETSDEQNVVCCGGRALVGPVHCPECSYTVVDQNDLPSDAGPPTTDDATGTVP